MAPKLSKVEIVLIVVAIAAVLGAVGVAVWFFKFRTPTQTPNNGTFYWDPTTQQYVGSFILNMAGASGPGPCQIRLYQSDGTTFFGDAIGVCRPAGSVVTAEVFNSGLSPLPSPGLIMSSAITGATTVTLTAQGFSTLDMDASGNITAS